MKSLPKGALKGAPFVCVLTGSVRRKKTFLHRPNENASAVAKIGEKGLQSRFV